MRPQAFGASGMTPDGDAILPPRTISASSGLPGIGGRISREQGDNLARLAPAPVEQPTIALRKRRPEAGAPREDAEAEHHAAVAAGAPHPQPQQARPAVAVEAWVPSYDDILPARSARSGRSFRLRK